jgi:hypothetical protein
MPFTGDGSGTLSIIAFFASGVGAIFSSLDNIQFFDAPFSILDIFVAILVWELVSWFIIRLITSKDKQENDYTGVPLTAEETQTAEGLAMEDMGIYDE